MSIKGIIFDLDDTLYDTHAQTATPAAPLPGTAEALQRLKSKYKLFLVTLGNPTVQKAKVTDHNLAQYFKKIFYVDSSKYLSKKETFSTIMAANSLLAHEMVSIGNRVDTDVRWAKELGMFGVLFEYGDYQNLIPQGPEEKPDGKVKSLEEFEGWLND